MNKGIIKKMKESILYKNSEFVKKKHEIKM